MPAELLDTIRVISWAELRKIIPLSRQHVYRLEKAGKFPSRLKLNPSAGDRGRVVWILAEIEAHVLKQAALRDTDHG